MIIIPAIDLKDGQCVRLYRGDFGTVHKVADDPVEVARGFERAGAQFIHVVDLDGAKSGRRANSAVVEAIVRAVSVPVELGGGIRGMDDVRTCLKMGVRRVILGSAALSDPEFTASAAREHGDAIAVGIDARDGYVSAQGWTQDSSVHFIELARRVDAMGVGNIIFTDISKDGMLAGPNIGQLCELKAAVACDITASGGVSSMADIYALSELGLYGAICGKALYSGGLDLREAIAAAAAPRPEESAAVGDMFKKSALVPAIIQDYRTGEALMLAYMNRESLRKTLESGFTWFYSRSRERLWQKGESSGHVQRVVSVRADCDSDTLLIKVEQTGPACHTGRRSCFYKGVRLDG